jgi:uncharacterized membrane protein required for colicin V production
LLPQRASPDILDVETVHGCDPVEEELDDIGTVLSSLQVEFILIQHFLVQLLYYGLLHALGFFLELFHEGQQVLRILHQILFAGFEVVFFLLAPFGLDDQLAPVLLHILHQNQHHPLDHQLDHRGRVVECLDFLNVFFP